MNSMASRRIGLRALRRELSEAIHDVRGGDEILVTDRGRPVARLCPVDGQDVVARLQRQGKLIPAEEPKGPLSVEDAIPVSGSVSDLIIDERERIRTP